jgi:hypothetical protein
MFFKRLDTTLKRKPQRTKNILSHDYATKLVECLIGEEPNSSQFCGKTMSWLQKLRVIVRATPDHLMSRDSWIDAIAMALKDMKIDFLPARTKNGLTAVNLEIIVHPHSQRFAVEIIVPMVVPTRQVTVVPNINLPPVATAPNLDPHPVVSAFHGAVLPFSIPLGNQVPPCLAEAYQKEMQTWKKAELDADNLIKVERRQPAKDRAVALETFFKTTYSVFNFDDPYHRMLVTTGLILRLSEPIPNAEKQREHLDWVYKIKKDKDRWLLMFVITGVYYASSNLRREMEEKVSKELRENIKSTLGIGFNYVADPCFSHVQDFSFDVSELGTCDLDRGRREERSSVD